MSEDPSGHDHPAATNPTSLKGLTMALGIEPAAPGQDPLLGRDIGGVTLLRLIAEGGMGRVYEGLQQVPKRKVAVKVMRPGLVSRQASQRFGLELEILGRLRHPYIAQVYSAGVCDVAGAQVPFFVMEFIPDALPITRYAKERLLDTDARLRLFKQVCEAVAHGHQQGIVHRDLKPSNILVEADGIPKIIDFGIARTLTDSAGDLHGLTEVGQLIGTLQYMSPEQITADPQSIDARTDVYALGVILYELLTGTRPYEISSKQLLEAARIIHERLPPSPLEYNRHLRPEVVKIATTCLYKDKTHRFSSATELGQAVEQYLAGIHVAGLAHESPAPPRRIAASFLPFVGILGFAFGALCLGWMATRSVPSAVPTCVNTIGMKFARIPAGAFDMGDGSGEPEDRPVREVRLPTPFCMGVHEVTNAQWKAVMGVARSESRGDDFPVTQVSWSEAMAFCNKLSSLPAEQAARRTYRLPTEAEWEYACRAGSPGRYSFGESAAALPTHAWFNGNAGHEPHPVGTRRPNRWGLHDMHGNVGEWCSDWLGIYPDAAEANPSGPFAGFAKVFRGGSWRDPPELCRSGKRLWFEPGQRTEFLGLRVVLVEQEQASAKTASLPLGRLLR